MSSIDRFATMKTKYKGDFHYVDSPLGLVLLGQGEVSDKFGSYYPGFKDKPTGQFYTDLAEIATREEVNNTIFGVWNRIRSVWNWIEKNTEVDNDEYKKILDAAAGTWPSPKEYGDYFNEHGKLPLAACFSKAHVFCTLLFWAGIAPWRFGIASAPFQVGSKIANHEYTAVYLGNLWYPLDLTAVYNRKLLAEPIHNVKSLSNVDYAHPTKYRPYPPGLPLTGVPYMGETWEIEIGR